MLDKGEINENETPYVVALWNASTSFRIHGQQPISYMQKNIWGQS